MTRRMRPQDAAYQGSDKRAVAGGVPVEGNVLASHVSQGVQFASVRALAQHWTASPDRRTAEAKLNAFPHFITEIDGVDIHFIHVQSKEPNALPVIVTHGWPGSIIEQLKIIVPLTNPAAHGASASDAFDVVIPSLPSHGFSGKPTVP